MRKRIIEVLTRPFRRRRGRTTANADPHRFWRDAESFPLKLSLIEQKWGKGTVPTVLFYDLTPLRSLGHDEEQAVAKQFYPDGKAPLGAISWRDSQSDASEVTTFLIVKHARYLPKTLVLRGRDVPLYRASHRSRGSAGNLLEFVAIQPKALDALQPTG